MGLRFKEFWEGFGDLETCAKPSSKSGFLVVQKISLQYILPHPITFLDNPPIKYAFKRMIKSAVMDYWEKRLCGQALCMKSLTYFHPAYMSLSQTHALFTSCGSSPYEILKAVVLARYLSGRARVALCERG